MTREPIYTPEMQLRIDNTKLRSALEAAKAHIISLHPRGDQRQTDAKYGDVMQMGVLDVIDAALR